MPRTHASAPGGAGLGAPHRAVLDDQQGVLPEQAHAETGAKCLQRAVGGRDPERPRRALWISGCLPQHLPMAQPQKARMRIECDVDRSAGIQMQHAAIDQHLLGALAHRRARTGIPRRVVPQPPGQPSTEWRHQQSGDAAQ
ncbi:hypothetical protein G6F64_014123 [Rhizopus arrhizus]|uniref:Uncharacterized protein n=1 Tax=Rhizopus oryzae TaxID=64495 RepID=A0A9P6WUL5_RHIOR|nr:hypothetical protein G6F64_014123 [Rhizopus arrhizus]